MGSAEKPFKSADYCIRALARVRPHHEIGVGWFTIDCCGELSIGETLDVTVQKGDTVIFLVFDGKLDSLMHLIEA